VQRTWIEAAVEAMTVDLGSDPTNFGSDPVKRDRAVVATDSHFKRKWLSVEEPIGRVNRPFSVATGCSARLLRRFRAGTDAKVAARGQTGGGRHEPARRRQRVCANYAMCSMFEGKPTQACLRSS
jgi:hypothetical protein